MSVLTPEIAPVKIYRWDDAGALPLSRSTGSATAIIRSCLVSGYGGKEAAGWTLPFSSATVNVIRPAVGVNADFYLRLSADTGSDLVAQVYTDMSNADNGTLKLQCDTPFRYATTNISGKWVLIATDRSFWFLSEHSFSGTHGKNGSWFFAGDIGRNDAGFRAVYLHHTGGAISNISFATLTGTRNGEISKSSGTYVSGKMMLSDGSVVTSDPECMANGTKELSQDGTVMPVIVRSSTHVYQLIGAYMPFNGAKLNSFDYVDVVGLDDYHKMVVSGTGVRESNNVYFSTDSWGY